MRIEYQGTIEARPAYVHVGYCLAMRQEAVVDRHVQQSGMALLTLGVMLVVAARRLAHRAPRYRAVALALAALVTLATGLNVVNHRVVAHEKRYVEPDAVTHFRIADRTRDLDRVVRGRMGVPATVSWAWSPQKRRGSIEDGHCDGWGTRLRYRLRSRPGPDLRRFELYSAGPDGRFDTEDDVRPPLNLLLERPEGDP